jgi:hypothetical protein
MHPVSCRTRQAVAGIGDPGKGSFDCKFKLAGITDAKYR